jgi:hypothetical protein
MEETIDLQEHMRKKREEAFREAFERVGMALDGISMDVVLTILAHTARNCVAGMNEFNREKNIKIFGDIMRLSNKDMGVPEEGEETLQ